MNSEFFSTPNIAFIVKYINTVDITSQKLANGAVIVLTFVPNIVNILTTDAMTDGMLAEIIAVITVVNCFLFFVFITNTIKDITNTLTIGVIRLINIDNIALPTLDNPHIWLKEKLLLINLATTHIASIIIP